MALPLRQLLEHTSCAVSTLEMAGSVEFSAPSELPEMLGLLARCPTLHTIDLSGHGGGDRPATTSALLDFLRLNRSVSELDVRLNHFPLSSFSFGVLAM